MDAKMLGDERYVSITTFKRDGTAVSTPVWVVSENGSLLVHSAASTWKVKRIRRDGHVRVAPCSVRGVVRGEPIDADATVVEETETVAKLLARKYGLMFRVAELVTATMRKLRRQGPFPSVTIRIVPR